MTIANACSDLAAENGSILKKNAYYHQAESVLKLAVAINIQDNEAQEKLAAVAGEIEQSEILTPFFRPVITGDSRIEDKGLKTIFHLARQRKISAKDLLQELGLNLAALWQNGYQHEALSLVVLWQSLAPKESRLNDESARVLFERHGLLAEIEANIKETDRLTNEAAEVPAENIILWDDLVKLSRSGLPSLAEPISTVLSGKPILFAAALVFDDLKDCPQEDQRELYYRKMIQLDPQAFLPFRKLANLMINQKRLKEAGALLESRLYGNNLTAAEMVFVLSSLSDVFLFLYSQNSDTADRNRNFSRGIEYAKKAVQLAEGKDAAAIENEMGESYYSILASNYAFLATFNAIQENTPEGLARRKKMAGTGGPLPAFLSKQYFDKAMKYAGDNVHRLILVATQTKGCIELNCGLLAIEKALGNEPDNLTALSKLGLALIELDRPAEAVPVLQKVIAADPENVDCRVNLGLAYWHLNKYDEAVAVYHELITALKQKLVEDQSPDIKENYFTAHLNLGASLDKKGEYTAAAENYAQARAFALEAGLDIADQITAGHGQILALIRAEKYDEAREKCEENLRLRLDHDILNRLTQIFLKQQDFERALANLKILWREFPNADDFLEIIAKFEKAGFWDNQDLQFFLHSIPPKGENFLSQARREYWLRTFEDEVPSGLKAFLDGLKI
ncbi:MAG: tetratricopeptide repeat protein, partial [bacterium]|nr:tetratricopeptide repeat protein [bacterium]